MGPDCRIARYNSIYRSCETHRDKAADRPQRYTLECAQPYIDNSLFDIHTNHNRATPIVL